MICKPNILARQRQRRRQVTAFTMIEIVLSLAVIAVAMVAIIGVLPLGMNVQSENRETSIINTDAGIWIKAIGGGAQGMEYLKDYVQEVSITETRRDILTRGIVDGPTTIYLTNFVSGSNLLGVLSYPKYRTEIFGGELVVVDRAVYADVRALNGNMGDLIADNDFAFKYRMTPELIAPELPAVDAGSFQGVMQTNLYDLSVNFAWPLIIGEGGGHRNQTTFSKDITFRTLISGNQLVYPNEDDPSEFFYFMNPRQYTHQPQ